MAREVTYEVPGIGVVSVPTVVGPSTGFTSISDSIKKYPCYRNLSQVAHWGLQAIDSTADAELFNRRGDILRNSIPSCIAVVSKALGELLVKHGILDGNQTDAEVPDGIAHAWDTPTGHLVRCIALEGLLTAVKPITENNSDYVKTRYQAFCAGIKTTPPLVFPLVTGNEWYSTMAASQSFRTAVCVYLEKNEETSHQLVHFLAQIKMVWRGYKLTTTNAMHKFATETTSSILLKTTVAKEASEFIKLYNTVEARLGEFFQYSKVMSNKEVEVLNHKNFPTLYTVAVRQEKRTNLFTENLIITKGLQTALTNEAIDRDLSIELPPGARRAVGGAATEVYYRELGIDLNAALPGRAEDETRRALQMLAAQLTQQNRGTSQTASQAGLADRSDQQ